MVVGDGDIASVLIDREGITFLASGLSNSMNVTYSDFKREQAMITCFKDTHVVYFSSLSIYYCNSPYAQYKKDIEEYIQQTCKSYTIVRLGNITWGTNPNTLLNYLKAHPKAERRDEVRYLIDKEEFLHWMDKIRIGEKDIMNLTGKPVNVKNL